MKAAFGVVALASAFKVEAEPTAAMPVGKTCSHPDPWVPSTVTLIIAAVAVAGITLPVMVMLRVESAESGRAGVPSPERESARRVSVTGTYREAFGGAARIAAAVSAPADGAAPMPPMGARSNAPPISQVAGTARRVRALPLTRFVRIIVTTASDIRQARRLT